MSNAKILIVDANARALKEVSRVLAHAGYEVTSAATGRQAEQLVASCRPHLVLLDFVLPDVPGTEVLRRLKADPESNGVSVVLMSSLFGTPLEHSADLDADADGYIVRPISNHELLARVRGILRQRELVHSLRVSQRQNELLLHSIGEGIHGIDRAGRITFENPAAIAIFGWTEREMIGREAHATIHHHRADGSEYPIEECQIRQTLRDGKTREVNNEVFFRKDGSSFPVEYICSPIRDEAGGVAGAVLVFRDVTEQRLAVEKLEQAEVRILRLNRVYALLSALNAELVRIPDREYLFDTACRIAVDTGKMHAACIGLLDEQTGDARVVAHAGNMRDYHKVIRVSGAIGPLGGGPFGVCMREGRPVVCNDIDNDPTFAPWRENAMKRGFRSVGVFPLKLNGRTFGGYAHYADVPNFFDAEEIRLLDALAANISFAVEYLVKEQRRQAAEGALRDSEERLRAIYEQA